MLQLSIEGFSLMVTGLVQDSTAFVCREGLPLDYGAVAEDPRHGMKCSAC